MVGALMPFKDMLRRLREAAELTQEQLAEKSGIPLSSLRSHEQGQRIPSWAAVVKLARALGVTTDTFAECDEVAEVADEDAEKPKKVKKPKGGKK